MRNLFRLSTLISQLYHGSRVICFSPHYGRVAVAKLLFLNLLNGRGKCTKPDYSPDRLNYASVAD